MRSTTLPMESFGKEAIDRHAKAQGISPSAVIQDAAVYYLADRDRRRHAWSVPRFMRDEEQRSAPDEELEVDIDEATWAALEQEALRQAVSPVLLLRHAVLYFLADA